MKRRGRRGIIAPVPPPDFDPEAFPMYVDLGLDARPREEVERIYVLTREWADANGVELHPDWYRRTDPYYGRLPWKLKGRRVVRWT